jgi:hypothetical protein
MNIRNPEQPKYFDDRRGTRLWPTAIYSLIIFVSSTIWFFNIAMEAMAHLRMIFPARNLHL